MDALKLLGALCAFIFTIAPFLAIFWKSKRRKLLWSAAGSFVLLMIIAGIVPDPDLKSGREGPSQTESFPAQSSPPAVKINYNKAFCAVLGRYREKFKASEDNQIRRQNAENELRSDMPISLVEAIQLSADMPDGYGMVVGWEAELIRVSVSQDQFVSAVFKSACDVDLVLTVDAQIKVGDSVAIELARFSEGSEVILSGFLMPGADRDLEKGFPYKELSVTLDGALRNPELVFVPVSVSSLNARSDNPSEEEVEVLAAAKVFHDRHEAQEMECRKDLTCWAERYLIDANIACAPRIEALAKYDFEWTNGFLEKKFDRYKWEDPESGSVGYYGDYIKFQNGFGAWATVKYRCIYDGPTGAVIFAEAEQGRL